MPPLKFKLRLGAQQHVKVSGKQYVSSYAADTFNCRVTLRCDALQASGNSDFTRAQLESFVDSLVHIVSELQGTCELVPSKCGNASLHVAVTDTGAIATDVKFTKLTSSATAQTGWNAAARFHCDWGTYYDPIDVTCLNVPSIE